MPTQGSSPDFGRSAATAGVTGRVMAGRREGEPALHVEDPVPGMVYEVVSGSGDRIAACLIDRTGGAGVIWLRQADRADAARHLDAAIDRPEIMVCVVRDDAEAGWAAEEALRTRGVGLVVIELAARDPGCCRRLALAAAEGGGIGLVLWLEPSHHRSMSLPVEMLSDDTALAVVPTGQPARRSVPAAVPTRWKAAFA